MHSLSCLLFFGYLMLNLPQGDIPAKKVTIQQTPPDIPVYTYRVVNQYDHDRNAFTQGLVYENGMLYEGTGQFGESSLRWVELETGEVLQKHDLENKFFGEGITLFEGKLIQLTWLSNTGFVYDQFSFAELRRFAYPWQGWGITHDGTYLIMSDGTDTLHFLNPHTFELVRDVTVTLNGNPIRQLNELEYIKGEVYANVWMTDTIVRIDPASGKVNSIIDLSGLLPPIGGFPRPDVLNGIAYDKDNERLFVTGKRWPILFHIEIMLKNSGSNVKNWQSK